MRDMGIDIHDTRGRRRPAADRQIGDAEVVDQSATRMPSPHVVRQIAVLAACDVRPVQRFLRGERVRQTIGDRIEVALRQLGVEHTRTGARHG